jgi:hypothetical protein
MSIHIIPINDLKPHDETTTCDCFPKVQFEDNGEMLVIHNSFDGREKTEKPKERTLDKKLFRQWLIGVLAEGKDFTKDNALKSVNKANEIIDFMEKHGIINPLIK